MNDAHIETLLSEYADFVKRKLPKRAAQAKAELARYGVDPKKKAD